jgi:predicted amidophosphoribosyltransferase
LQRKNVALWLMRLRLFQSGALCLGCGAAVARQTLVLCPARRFGAGKTPEAMAAKR